MQRLLKDAGGGLLEEHLGPLARRLDELTRHQRLNLGEAASRLRFPAIAARPAGAAFDTVASATLQRRKLWIEYHARSTDERSERTVSPQRITHYREAWYLDAWDEKRDALRSFSIDRISTRDRARGRGLRRAGGRARRALRERVRNLRRQGGQGGRAAVHRRSARAGWRTSSGIRSNRASGSTDGSYELRIPYREPRELVMDVMRQGASVEVVSPPELRDRVADELRAAASRYR